MIGYILGIISKIGELLETYDISNIVFTALGVFVAVILFAFCKEDERLLTFLRTLFLNVITLSLNVITLPLNVIFRTLSLNVKLDTRYKLRPYILSLLALFSLVTAVVYYLTYSIYESPGGVPYFVASFTISFVFFCELRNECLQRVFKILFGPALRHLKGERRNTDLAGEDHTDSSGESQE